MHTPIRVQSLEHTHTVNFDALSFVLHLFLFRTIARLSIFSMVLTVCVELTINI